MLFVLLMVFRSKKIWLTLFSILVLFEVAEATFFIAVLKLFRPEKIVDVFNDIFIGMLGGYLIYCFFRRNKNKKHSELLAAFISGITIAFVWVGWYGYSYNIPFFNSPCLNWWAFCCWTIVGVAMIVVFKIIKNKMNFILSLSVVWIIYIILLFTVEYLAYQILDFREITNGATPLIFNIVHGTPIMHVFYTTAPIYFISLFVLLSSLFQKYEKESKC